MTHTHTVGAWWHQRENIPFQYITSIISFMLSGSKDSSEVVGATCAMANQKSLVIKYQDGLHFNLVSLLMRYFSI